MGETRGSGFDALSSEQSRERFLCPCCGSRLALTKTGHATLLEEDTGARDLPAAAGTMFIDPHAHMISRTTDDYEAMARAGVVAVIEPSFWLGQPRTSLGSYTRLSCPPSLDLRSFAPGSSASATTAASD